MSSEPAPEALLAVAKASPAAVARHDRDAWLSLFATNALVNDPVGSRPHVGRAALGRFYDTFIAPNAIRFEVHREKVTGMTVMRDVSIVTTMSSGLTISVPAIIRYEIVEEFGQLKIRGLYAYWRLLPMIGQVLGSGIKGLMTMASLSVQMLKHQGLRGVLGFMRGFFYRGKPPPF